MFHDIKRILILAPHPDDAEFGLGGTLHKLKALGKEIHLAVFSLCEKSTPQGFEVGIIEKELYQSCEFFEIDKAHRHIFNYEVRLFPQFRQDILETMVSLNKEIRPDMVFMPSSSDIHQDDNTIHNEGIRAFKYASLLGYEMPWNNFGFTSFVYVNLSEEDIEAKITALSKYKSQSHRSYSAEEFVQSLAKLRGTQIKQKYAESFELIRHIQY